MNDNNAFERYVADHLADDGSGAAQAERLAARITEGTGEVRQQPHWLALVRHPVMRSGTRTTVGSPTVRVVGIMLATLLLALALAGLGIAGKQLLDDGAIVVDPTGGGDFLTVSEAVEAADDGDTIRVRPGTYREDVVLDKTVSLVGDGDRTSIVLVGATPWTSDETTPVALEISSDAYVADLTVDGGEGGTAVDLRSSPTLERVKLLPGVESALAIGEGSSRVIDSDIEGWLNVWVGGSTPTIEDSRLCGAHLEDAATLIGNTIEDGPGCPNGGISLGELGNASIIDNDIRLSEEAIIIRASDGSIAPAIIEGNRISGAERGIIFEGGGAATIRGNELVDVGLAIELVREPGVGEVTIEDNTLDGGTDGIVILAGSPAVTGNEVRGASDRGIAIAGTSPVLRDNVACDNGTDLWTNEFAAPDIDDSNEICGGVAPD